jgi:sugar/nucleoside kinase (ribokinase family)
VKVLCIGHACLDIVFAVDEYPAEDSKSVAGGRSVSGGGPAANAAALLAFWGADCGFAGPVGDDDFGPLVAAELRRFGVDLSALRVLPGYPTPVSAVIVNRGPGTRTIVNHRERADLYRLPRLYEPANPALLLFDGHAYHASREAMRRWPDAVTVLDAGSLRDSTRQLAARVDYLVASENFATASLGRPLRSETDSAEALEQLYGVNRRCAIITLGGRGGLWARGSERGSYAAFPVQAVDSTAAGDIFHGAFVFALAQGLPFVETLRFAAVSAGLSVAKPGGRSSFPALNEVRKLL